MNVLVYPPPRVRSIYLPSTDMDWILPSAPRVRARDTKYYHGQYTLIYYQRCSRRNRVTGWCVVVYLLYFRVMRHSIHRIYAHIHVLAIYTPAHIVVLHKQITTRVCHGVSVLEFTMLLRV